MRRRRQRFAGSVVFITGASSGIGAALSLEFAREGADVVLAARRRDRLESLAAEIGAIGRRAVVAECDVTREGDLERAAATGRAAFGKLDVVVANAGFGVTGLLERLSLDDYRRQLETNVFGMLRTVYATLPALRASRGTLVLMGSVSGYLATPGASPYAMSKFAVRALTEGLNLDVAGTAVRVSSVDPGFVETEFSVVRFGGDTERARKVYEGFQPLSADDVADAVAYVINLPEHVNVLDLVLVPTAQRNVYVVDRQVTP